MRLRANLAFLALALLCGTAHGEVISLTFTIPSGSQLRYIAPDPTDPGDSTLLVECAGGPAATDADSVRIIRWPATGGPPTVAEAVSVRGLAGVPMTVYVDDLDGAHFTTVVVDTAGNPSCDGNVIYSGTETAVPAVIEALDPTVSLRLFTVNGAIAKGRLASGIYFEKRVRRSGRVESSRVVVLR